MVILSATLAVRINGWAVGGMRSQLRVSLSTLFCAETTGRRDSAFCRRVATSLRTPVSPELYCGSALLGGA